MSISTERKAVHHSQRLAQLNCLLFILAAMVMPFHASMAADTPSPPRAADAMVRHGAGTIEPAKTDVPPSPQQAKCLLALGDAPRSTKLLPGISQGKVDPGAADKSAHIRIWSQPDRQEPDVMLHYVEISSPRFQVLGIHSGFPPYGIEMLTLHAPTVALPCGLRVGQPMDQFIKALGQPFQGGIIGEVEYYWEKFFDSVSYTNGNILLRHGPKQLVEEIRWEYGIH
jgi:hypothetical protein